MGVFSFSKWDKSVSRLEFHSGCVASQGRPPGGSIFIELPRKSRLLWLRGLFGCQVGLNVKGVGCEKE